MAKRHTSTLLERLARGDEDDRFSLKERRFILEYSIGLDGKAAAVAAGYDPHSAAITACKMLKKRRIAEAIVNEQKRVFNHLRLTKEELLLHLFYCSTRTDDDFRDSATGELLATPTVKGKHCINGYDQTVTILTDAEGNETGRKVHTKLRLVPKESALDLAMRHKGLFEIDNQQRANPITIQVQAVLQALDDRRQGKMVESEPTPALEGESNEP